MISKKSAMEFLLQEPVVALHLDPKAPGVVLPEMCRDAEALILHVGLDMPVPVNDLTLTDEAFTATLSFEQTPFTVTIPWPAVFYMSAEGRAGVAWPESVPDVLKGMAPDAGPSVKNHGGLRLVD